MIGSQWDTHCMSVVAIIPARYGSTRFPGKPLARETGKALIQHVCERVALAERIQCCLVATDDSRIAEAVRSFGGQAVITRADHASGTDRIAEVARTLSSDIIVNVQGDEPEIEPGALDRLVDRLERDARCDCATLACPFPPDADPRDPNAVKVVTDQSDRALYFSRALIPYAREEAVRPEWLLHLGVYALRREFLLQFAQWAPTPLERVEQLEQLRMLEHGCVIAVERVEQAPIGVDTPEDYRRFVERYRAGATRRES
jgi:3-deoxy-manno-octulosonate cytidylyltransferase (CMP-KDO synthetase)